MNFETMGALDPAREETWRTAVFLTFDLDWAADDIVADTLALLARYRARATFFVTHATPLLERCVAEGHELGLHPNFLFLMEGDTRYGRNIDEVVATYKALAPEAVAARSHGVIEGGAVHAAFRRHGIRYDCNSYIPYESGIVLKPWRHQSDLTKVPFYWADDGQLIYSDFWNVDKYVAYEGLKVFAFHPIHVFLNTESLARYHDCKPWLADSAQLATRVNRAVFGTRDFLVRLLERVAAEG